jgi:hypothetical protein
MFSNFCPPTTTQIFEMAGKVIGGSNYPSLPLVLQTFNRLLTITEKTAGLVETTDESTMAQHLLYLQIFMAVRTLRRIWRSAARLTKRTYCSHMVSTDFQNVYMTIQ